MAQSPPGPIICKFSGITTMWEKAAGPPWSRVCRRARESVGGSGRRFAHGTRVKQDPFKESCLTIQGPCCCTVGLMAIVSNTKFLSSATIVKLNSRFDLLCSMVQSRDFLHSCGHCRFCKNTAVQSLQACGGLPMPSSLEPMTATLLLRNMLLGRTEDAF